MIVLVGFMGAGKTTVGQLLAGKLGLPFTDSDLVIEQRSGRPVRQIFAEEGEPAFRALEHQTVTGLLRGPDAVLALGGGAVEHPETRQALRAAQVVYLQVGYGEAMQRVAGDEYRPMLRTPGLEDLYRRRLAAYESVAALTVATDGRSPGEICLGIIERLAGLQRWQGSWRSMGKHGDGPDSGNGQTDGSKPEGGKHGSGDKPSGNPHDGTEK